MVFGATQVSEKDVDDRALTLVTTKMKIRTESYRQKQSAQLTPL